MNTMRIYSSMQEGMSYAPTRSDANTNEIVERKKNLRQLCQTIRLRHRQKAIYARKIAYYRRKIKLKTKRRDKLAKKLAGYDKPFRKLLQQQREKIKLDMEKQRNHLQYLKKMSQVTRSALNVYRKERRAYKRKFKASKMLHLTKNTALKNLKKRIRITKEKHEDIIEVIEDLKKKLKLAKERRKSLSLKDLKKQIQLNKERLEVLQKKQIEQVPLIYEVLTDSKMTGFQRKTTVVPVTPNTQLDSRSDILKKSKSQTKRTRRVRRGSFSTDTSMSKTSALNAAETRQSEPIVIKRDTLLEPIPIGDKLQDKPKRLAHRFSKKLADRTRKSKRSSSPPGDYKTPTTISAESDDTGLELKAKKKRVTLNIDDEPLADSEEKSPRSQEATSSQEEISLLKMVFDDNYFDKLVGKHGSRIRRELHEARLQKKLELEKKMLEEAEEKRKRAMEFVNKNDLRTSSMDSTRSNHVVKMAMKSTYKMTDVIPHNIQIIDEDILQLAEKNKRQTLHDVLQETEKKLEQSRILLNHLKAMKAVPPIPITNKTIRRSKLLKRRSSRKSQIKAEAKDLEEQVTEEQVPKEIIFKKKVRKQKMPKTKVPAASLTFSEDTVFNEPTFDDSMHDDLFNEDFMRRKSRKSFRSSGKKIEGLAYNNNSMYHKFIAEKKYKLPEQRHGSVLSIGSIGKRTSGRGSKQKPREFLEFRKDVQEIPKPQQETLAPPVEAPKNIKSSKRVKRKSRVSIKTVTSISLGDNINVIAPQQKDGLKEKTEESSRRRSSKAKPKTVHYASSKTDSLPKIQVQQVDAIKEELPPTEDEHSSAQLKPKEEYDENYFQRLFKAHSAIIKRRLHQERMKKIELQKRLLALEEEERDSLEKSRKSLASERASSFDSVAIMQKAIASTYSMPDVIPQNIPVVDENILKLAGKTRRQTMKDVLSEKFGPPYSEEYPRVISPLSPVHKSSVEFQRKSKLFKKKRSQKSKTKKLTKSDSEISEQIIKVIDLQASRISLPDDKFSNYAAYDDSSIVDRIEESEAFRWNGKNVEGLAYDHNSMYKKYIDEKKHKSDEEKRASLAIEETPQSTKPRTSIKRKTFETVPYKSRSRKSIKRRPKKFVVIKSDPISFEEISQRQSEIRTELYQTHSYPPVESEVQKTHSEPKLGKSNKIGKKSKSLPDVSSRPPEVQVVCNACGMTNLTPGGPCCPLIPKTK